MMQTSQTVVKIAPALLKAQAAIANAVKTGTNPHFKNKYAPLEEVIKVCKESLNAQGISFVQGGETSDGDLLHLSTRLMHESGEWIESTLSMKPVKADPQGIGSCITYARRYALAAMCGVASEDDDDANAASHAPTKPSAPKPAPTPQEETKLQTFMRLWTTLPEKKRNDINYCSTFLPLVANWEDVREQKPSALAEAIDKLNIVLEESK